MQLSERHIQDRLGVVLQRLATLEQRAAVRGESRATQNLLTDFRRLARDFERAFETLQEAGAQQAMLQRQVEIAGRRATILLDLGPLPYVLVQSDGVILDANAAAGKALNTSLRHLKGKSFDIFLQAEREAFLDRLQRLHTGGELERWPAVVRPRERYPRAMTIVALPEAPGQIALVLSAPDTGPSDGSDTLPD